MTANENKSDGAKLWLRPIYVQMGPTTPDSWAAEMRKLITRAAKRAEAKK